MMYEKLEICPSCKHTHQENYMICSDHSVTHESFALVKCSKCQLIFTNPRPGIDHISHYYKSEAYISHTNKSNNLINVVYKLARTFTLRSKYKLISKHHKTGRLLDFGCGTGAFTKYMLDRNWTVNGLETDKDARTIAMSHTNTTILTSLEELKKQEKYDVITAWHVIEHVHDLRDTLKALRKKLNPGGTLFIAVPNVSSYDAQYYREMWAAYDVPRHLYHFTRTSFSKLAKKAKLEIVEVLPMKLDSFYVSLLSEKYKSGKPNYLKALQLGLRSNTLASRNGEYSSLIYVLNK